MLKIPLNQVTRIAAGNPKGMIIIEEPKPQAKVSGSAEIKGLGDVVAMIAQPIARGIDKIFGTNVQNCGGCKNRQETLNNKFPLG